ncbi:hypothetical protein CPC735_058780 [Coccidioides posadasii C735 delta SOWgp]|uniref:Lysine-specific metallo-endopeptidase domain-containing protein n=1 Tax=Coccidioides posadasii (strain C735) TaxID=222929 RepID=C5PEI8_COCP7|nr:hypothetical protein CPC735_058780 [Coccidioides posadasii C735 delta SOWgp]EER24508.1 hypothetical protein CPC735_058780 [Coccidioides posadasii C735 delta SOWgp]|eukprot:XP_003066653.1 hypothetical protein CPC735_058780 [Coccidioides posadasii C735 delta SOWgp]
MKFPVPGLSGSFMKLLVVALSTQLVSGNGSFHLKVSDCSLLEEGLVFKAVKSMKLAASVAEDRTKKLLEVLRKNPGPDDSVKGSDISSLMFFETMFGEVDPCGGVQRVEDIYKRIVTFRETLQNPQYKVNIVCREAFLKQEEGRKLNYHHLLNYICRSDWPWLVNYTAILVDMDTEVMDMRPPEWGGQRLNFVESKDQLFPCKSGETQAWSSTKYDMEPELVDLTVLCDQVLKSSNWNEYNSVPYETLRKKEFEPDSRKIDDIDDYNLATILTHEFSHSGSIYDCDPTGMYGT